MINFNAYALVCSERENQKAEGYTPERDDALPLLAWVALLTRHAGLAVDDGGGVPPERFRRQMVRCAALALAALESLERRGGRGPR